MTEDAWPSHGEPDFVETYLEPKWWQLRLRLKFFFWDLQAARYARKRSRSDH